MKHRERHRSPLRPHPMSKRKHQRSIVTFRNHTVAAMFCIPCEHAWTESTTHPELREIGLDQDGSGADRR